MAGSKVISPFLKINFENLLIFLNSLHDVPDTVEQYSFYKNKIKLMMEFLKQFSNLAANDNSIAEERLRAYGIELPSSDFLLNIESILSGATICNIEEIKDYNANLYRILNERYNAIHSKEPEELRNIGLVIDENTQSAYDEVVNYFNQIFPGIDIKNRTDISQCILFSIQKQIEKIFAINGPIYLAVSAKVPQRKNKDNIDFSPWSAAIMKADFMGKETQQELMLLVWPLKQLLLFSETFPGQKEFDFAVLMNQMSFANGVMEYNEHQAHLQQLGPVKSIRVFCRALLQAIMACKAEEEDKKAKFFLILRKLVRGERVWYEEVINDFLSPVTLTQKKERKLFTLAWLGFAKQDPDTYLPSLLDVATENIVVDPKKRKEIAKKFVSKLVEKYNDIKTLTGEKFESLKEVLYMWFSKDISRLANNRIGIEPIMHELNKFIKKDKEAGKFIFKNLVDKEFNTADLEYLYDYFKKDNFLEKVIKDSNEQDKKHNLLVEISRILEVKDITKRTEACLSFCKKLAGNGDSKDLNNYLYKRIMLYLKTNTSFAGRLDQFLEKGPENFTQIILAVGVELNANYKDKNALTMAMHYTVDYAALIAQGDEKIFLDNIAPILNINQVKKVEKLPKFLRNLVEQALAKISMPVDPTATPEQQKARKSAEFSRARTASLRAIKRTSAKHEKNAVQAKANAIRSFDDLVIELTNQDDPLNFQSLPFVEAPEVDYRLNYALRVLIAGASSKLNVKTVVDCDWTDYAGSFSEIFTVLNEAGIDKLANTIKNLLELKDFANDKQNIILFLIRALVIHAAKDVDLCCKGIAELAKISNTRLVDLFFPERSKQKVESRFFSFTERYHFFETISEQQKNITASYIKGQWTIYQEISIPTYDVIGGLHLNNYVGDKHKFNADQINALSTKVDSFINQGATCEQLAIPFSYILAEHTQRVGVANFIITALQNQKVDIVRVFLHVARHCNTFDLNELCYLLQDNKVLNTFSVIYAEVFGDSLPEQQAKSFSEAILMHAELITQIYKEPRDEQQLKEAIAQLVILIRDRCDKETAGEVTHNAIYFDCRRYKALKSLIAKVDMADPIKMFPVLLEVISIWGGAYSSERFVNDIKKHIDTIEKNSASHGQPLKANPSKRNTLSLNKHISNELTRAVCSIEETLEGIPLITTADTTNEKDGLMVDIAIQLPAQAQPVLKKAEKKLAIDKSNLAIIIRKQSSLDMVSNQQQYIHIINKLLEEQLSAQPLAPEAVISVISLIEPDSNVSAKNLLNNGNNGVNSPMAQIQQPIPSSSSNDEEVKLKQETALLQSEHKKAAQALQEAQAFKNKFVERTQNILHIGNSTLLVDAFKSAITPISEQLEIAKTAAEQCVNSVHQNSPFISEINSIVEGIKQLQTNIEERNSVATELLKVTKDLRAELIALKVLVDKAGTISNFDEATQVLNAANSQVESIKKTSELVHLEIIKNQDKTTANDLIEDARKIIRSYGVSANKKREEIIKKINDLKIAEAEPGKLEGSKSKADTKTNGEEGAIESEGSKAIVIINSYGNDSANKKHDEIINKINDLKIAEAEPLLPGKLGVSSGEESDENIEEDNIAEPALLINKPEFPIKLKDAFYNRNKKRWKRRGKMLAVTVGTGILGAGAVIVMSMSSILITSLTTGNGAAALGLGPLLGLVVGTVVTTGIIRKQFQKISYEAQLEFQNRISFSIGDFYEALSEKDAKIKEDAIEDVMNQFVKFYKDYDYGNVASFVHVAKAAINLFVLQLYNKTQTLEIDDENRFNAVITRMIVKLAERPSSEKTIELAEKDKLKDVYVAKHLLKSTLLNICGQNNEGARNDDLKKLFSEVVISLARMNIEGSSKQQYVLYAIAIVQGAFSDVYQPFKGGNFFSGLFKGDTLLDKLQTLWGTNTSKGQLKILPEMCQNAVDSLFENKLDCRQLVSGLLMIHEMDDSFFSKIRANIPKQEVRQKLKDHVKSKIDAALNSNSPEEKLALLEKLANLVFQFCYQPLGGKPQTELAGIVIRAIRDAEVNVPLHERQSWNTKFVLTQNSHYGRLNFRTMVERVVVRELSLSTDKDPEHKAKCKAWMKKIHDIWNAQNPGGIRARWFGPKAPEQGEKRPLVAENSKPLFISLSLGVSDDSILSGVEGITGKFDPLKLDTENVQPKVDSSDSKVDSSDSKVDSSDPKVDSSDPKVDSSDPKVDSSDSKVDSSDPKVNSSDDETLMYDEPSAQDWTDSDSSHEEEELIRRRKNSSSMRNA